MFKIRGGEPAARRFKCSLATRIIIFVAQFRVQNRVKTKLHDKQV